MLSQMLRRWVEDEGSPRCPPRATAAHTACACFCPLTAAYWLDLSFQFSLVAEFKIPAFISSVPLPNLNLPE